MSGPGGAGRGSVARLLLAALPFVLVASMVAAFGVDVPYWDEWELVPYLDLLSQGRLSLALLWAQHSEHRLLFPRAAMLALARWSGWDVRWEMALGLGLALSSYAIFLRLLDRSAARAGVLLPVWLPGLASLLVFSLRQWENWIWGWQLQIHMNVLAVVAGVSLATGEARRRTLRLVAAGALGLVAQYSFACGMAYWPIVAVALAAERRETTARLKTLALWVGWAAACAASYLVGYVRPAWSSDPWLFSREPLRFGAYVLAYLGGPLSPEGDSRWIVAWAVAAGLAGLLLAGYASQRLVSERRLPLSELLPYLSLALYAVAAAVLGAVGRLGNGPTQALLSRYVTIGQLLWLADAALVGLWLGSASGRPLRGRAPALALAAIGVAAALASASGGARLIAAFERLQPARRALLERRDSPALAVLHPDRQLLWQRARVLERLRLSVYRP